MKRIKTTWEKITYDVWGNAKQGYEVNQSFRAGEVELDLVVDTYNVGTPKEFQCAAPSDKQLREVFGVPRVQLETDGDDIVVYVNRERDGYPIGELRCISHESLSPIKEKASVKLS